MSGQTDCLDDEPRVPTAEARRREIPLREISWKQLRDKFKKPPASEDAAPSGSRPASPPSDAPRPSGKTPPTTVVLVWTTTCGNCLQELPHYWKLARQSQRAGLRFATLNCDYDGIPGKPPSYFRERVLKWLRESPPTIQHWQLSDGFLDFLEAADIAETPTIIILESGRPPEFLQHEPAAADKPLLDRLRDHLKSERDPNDKGPPAPTPAPNTSPHTGIRTRTAATDGLDQGAQT